MKGITIVFLLMASVLFAGDITENGVDQGSLVRHLTLNAALTNTLRSNDIIEYTNALYHNNGPMSKLSAAGAVVEGVVAAGTNHTIVCVTQEIVVAGVYKSADATAECVAWDAVTTETVVAGKQRYYVLGSNGTAYTVVAGTAVDATSETAVIPAMTAGYAPLATILVKSVRGTATFTPGTTNWDATGVTTTDNTICILPSGAGAVSTPSAALSLSNQ